MGMHGDTAEVRKIKYQIWALEQKIRNLKLRIIYLKHNKADNRKMYLSIAKKRLIMYEQEKVILKDNLKFVSSKYVR